MKKSFIRKAKKHIKFIDDGDYFYVSHEITSEDKDIIKELGLGIEYTIPGIYKGNNKLVENIKGKAIINKSEKERYEVMINWKRPGWHGVNTGTSFYQRERFKREYGIPFKIKLTLITIENINYVMSEKLQMTDSNNDRNCFIINIFNELFNNFSIFSEDRILLTPTVNQLNWELLTSGIKENIDIFFTNIKVGKSLRNRSKFYYEKLTKNDKIEKIYKGTQGFNGYLSFVYKDSKYVILESLNPNNATYIFEASNWEELSKLTKQELIKDDKYIDRIIHFKESWELEIKKYLPERY